jgi:sarcosine oxidase
VAHDVIVAGLGAMGSAVAHAVSARGLRVAGIDRYAPPHTHGSSHGRSRLIREAIFEHPQYVPLVRRAFDLWQDLQGEAPARQLFQRTGGLNVGPATGSLVEGVRRSCAQHGIAHEVLSPRDIHRRYPAYTPLDDMLGVVEERAGLLFPERIIATQLAGAVRRGADLRSNERVDGIEPGGADVSVRTSRGTSRAGHVVVCAGAWNGALLAELGLPLVVERQVMWWFDALDHPELCTPERMPAAIWQLHSGRLFYAFPDVGDGVKTGIHHEGATVTPEAVERTVLPHEDATIFDLLRRFVPLAKGHIRQSATCLYTNTPDGDFIIDRHPADERVIIVSACSGHGFKFASVIGELVADMVTGATPRFDLSAFSRARFEARRVPRNASR